MASLGALGEIINASEVKLTENSNADIYIMLQDINLHIGRPEFRDPSTGAGAVYTYGKGDHWLTATMIATTPELDTLDALNDQDANGALTSNDWGLDFTDVSGAGKRATIPGFLNPLDIRKAAEGKVFVDIFIRITTETVVIATI